MNAPVLQWGQLTEENIVRKKYTVPNNIKKINATTTLPVAKKQLIIFFMAVSFLHYLGSVISHQLQWRHL
ncbi:MAG: hypothetical protein WAV16_02980 [Candidatus Moraniibacteriota bacterium]